MVGRSPYRNNVKTARTSSQEASMDNITRIRCVSIEPTTSGIQQSAWNYHFRTGYRHATVGIYNATRSVSLEQQQAYAAGHWSGHKEWRMKNLLKQS